MYDLVLFVLGVALAEVATTTRLRDWSWHAIIITLILTIVAVAGARRAAQRRRDRELYDAERRGEEKGRKAFKGAGKDELRWFDHALEVFYNRYCTDELLLANWIRLTVERSLQNRELLGGVISGVTIPRFTMGESRLVCHRTTPFRVDRPEELYLDLQLKWFSECRAKVAFELHALTGGGVCEFRCKEHLLADYDMVPRLGYTTFQLTTRSASSSLVATGLAPTPSTPPTLKVRVWTMTASGPRSFLTWARASAIVRAV